jgi:hypothetical protein
MCFGDKATLRPISGGRNNYIFSSSDDGRLVSLEAIQGASLPANQKYFLGTLVYPPRRPQISRLPRNAFRRVSRKEIR